LGYSKGSAKRKVYNCETLHNKQIREISNSLMTQVKILEKQEQAKPKISRWKEIIRIRVEINEVDITKKWYTESMNQRVGSLKR
jgi:hypothetical protein